MIQRCSPAIDFVYKNAGEAYEKAALAYKEAGKTYFLAGMTIIVGAFLTMLSIFTCGVLYQAMEPAKHKKT